jgi:hypothetical protein
MCQWWDEDGDIGLGSGDLKDLETVWSTYRSIKSLDFKHVPGVHEF